MFGIGIPELILIAIVALIVVGPKDLPVTLRAIGRAIREFQRASRELRKEAGFDEVVDEVTRPLREGLAGIEADVLREHEDTRYEYPESGPDDYDALPEGANVYPEFNEESVAAQAPAGPAARPAPIGTVSRKPGAALLDAPPATVAPDVEAPLHEDPIIAAKLRAAQGGGAMGTDAIIAAKLAAVGATSSDDPIIAAKLASTMSAAHAQGPDAVIAAKIRAADAREAAMLAKLQALAPRPAEPDGAQSAQATTEAQTETLPTTTATHPAGQPATVEPPTEEAKA